MTYGTNIYSIIESAINKSLQRGQGKWGAGRGAMGYYLTMRENLKLQLSPGLVASYDIQPGNGVEPWTLFCYSLRLVYATKESNSEYGGGRWRCLKVTF